MKKKRKIVKKAVLFLFIAAALVMSGHYGSLAYEAYQPVLKSNAQKKAVKEVVIKEEDPDDPINRVIDFAALKKINPDAAGWIYLPDSAVDYPVLIGETDTAYLKKDIEGNASMLGSIFSYADTSPTLQDARTVLFGHNMRKGTMFGGLKSFREEAYRENHRKIYLYTEKKAMELEIFSVFVCSDEEELFWKNPEISTYDYQNLLKELAERNQYPDIGKETIADDYNRQSVSLVTCYGRAGTSRRLVVNAIGIREKDQL